MKIEEEGMNRDCNEITAAMNKSINWKLFERPCLHCQEPISVKGFRKFYLWFAIRVLGVRELELMQQLDRLGYYKT